MPEISEVELNNGKILHDPCIKLPSDIGTDNSKKTIVWFNAIGFLILHLAALYGFYLFPQAKIATLIYTLIIIMLSAEGVTVGAHRLYSHKAFKATFALRLILIILQTTAGQNCLYIWVRDHRLHHKYADTDADPHNANRGFFFSHMGWLMSRKHPEVIRKGKTIDLSDLEADPVVMFQKKYYKPLYVIFAILVPVAIPCLAWNETWYNSFFICYLARFVTLLNFTWSINSVAHIFGSRPYDHNIKAVEMWYAFGWITAGEGWHNYHHAFPWDYRAAEFGLRYSFTTMMIDLCAYLGMAYDLKGTKDTIVKATSTKRGDGSHPHYGNWSKNIKKIEKEKHFENMDSNNNIMNDFINNNSSNIINNKEFPKFKDNEPKTLTAKLCT